MSTQAEIDDPVTSPAKPAVYLNSIEVRSGAEPELLREYYSLDCGEFRDALRTRLDRLLALPGLPGTIDPESDALALDLLIPDVEKGVRTFDTRYGLFQFDPMWRPQLTVRARLFALVTGETVVQDSVTEKMPFAEYYSRVFSLRSLVGPRSRFINDDLQDLALAGCLRILDGFRRSI